MSLARGLSSLSHNIRSVLRETAQSVAVVTSYMPGHEQARSKFHGATLSSFSSIALDPHPLVAFSLRIPSRMAYSLQAADPKAPSHMVINILSAAQAHTAVQFARPDMYPHPFDSCPHSFTKEGLPILNQSLGAFSCKLVSRSWPLHDLDALVPGNNREETVPWEGPGITSELFIARVIRAEDVPVVEGDDSQQTQPLLYHRQTYATTTPISGSIES